MSPKTDPSWLQDVNALIAFFDHDHVHNREMRGWFAKHHREGFDRHLPWQAIRCGSAKLVEHPV